MGPTPADPGASADRTAATAREGLAPVLPVGAPRRIAFLGLGLIGGSIAMAVRAGGAPVELAAWSPSGRGPDEARRRGLVDVVTAGPEACVDGADLVLLAGPPLAVLGALGQLSGSLGRAVASATLTDVASTKVAILLRANQAGSRFVGGHPMAGSDASGLGAGRADLFVGRPWVVVPGDAASADDIARVEALAGMTGAIPIRMTAEAHDAAVATVSHLPLVVAAALVEAMAATEAWPEARALAASGWRDMSRLARGDPEMGAGILATNADEVARRLRELRSALDDWLTMLERAGVDGAHAGPLRDRLAAARAALEATPADPRG